MQINKSILANIIAEELTASDKSEIKNMISKEFKKVLKKLYKDLSIQHPYIIDRIKV